MAEAVDISTWRGRFKAAWLETGLSGPELSARLGKNKNWAYATSTGHGSPDPETLAEFCALVGRSPDWIVLGEEAAGRSELVDGIVSYEKQGLDDTSRRVILSVAKNEVEESRLRAVSRSLSAEETELIVRYREASEAERSLTRAGLGVGTPQPQAERTSRPEAPTRRRPARPA